jgi:hypothetical protein
MALTLEIFMFWPVVLYAIFKAGRVLDDQRNTRILSNFEDEYPMNA